jgi:CBS domain-containing protein
MAEERSMKAREIMTRDVVTVTQSTSIAEIATLLVRNKISAVPVMSDDNRIAGIVSESDLMHRDETGTDHPKWWLELFLSADGRARDYVKSHGLKAENVMTRTVISVSEDADVANIADILESHRIRRVPVLRDGNLVGIISRSDFVRALAHVDAGARDIKRNDATLQKAIYEQVQYQPWINAALLSFTVKDGVADLRGFVDSDDQRQALQVLVEGVRGVQKVNNNVQRGPRQTGLQNIPSVHDATGAGKG